MIGRKCRKQLKMDIVVNDGRTCRKRLNQVDGFEMIGRRCRRFG
jgi:hypothetical protein